MSEYPLQFESDPTLLALAIASEGRKTMMAIIEENRAGDNEDEVANTAAHFEHLFSEIEDAMATCTTQKLFLKKN